MSRVKNGSDDLHNQDFALQLAVAHRQVDILLGQNVHALQCILEKHKPVGSSAF
jgi:hypothetical protein